MSGALVAGEVQVTITDIYPSTCVEQLGNQNNSHITLPLRFLEGLVKRLAAEVSEKQHRDSEEDGLGNKVRERPWSGRDLGWSGRDIGWRRKIRTVILFTVDRSPMIPPPLSDPFPVPPPNAPSHQAVREATLPLSAPPVGGLDDAGAGLPSWLRDRRYLNPLLAAYDERVALLEAQLAERDQGLKELKRQVEEVVGENDRLRAEARETATASAAEAAQASNVGGRAALEAVAVGAGAAGGGLEHRLALLSEENELLRRENDILVSQQVRLQVHSPTNVASNCYPPNSKCF